MKSAMLEHTRDVSPKGIFGWYSRTRIFLAQVRNEVEKVTWPTWKEVQATTFVVILVSFMFGIYLWGIDLVLGELAQMLFGAFAP